VKSDAGELKRGFDRLFLMGRVEQMHRFRGEIHRKQ